MATGINLQYDCNDMVFVDASSSAPNAMQCDGWILRIDQRRICYFYILIVDHSYDQVIQFNICNKMFDIITGQRNMEVTDQELATYRSTHEGTKAYDDDQVYVCTLAYTVGCLGSGRAARTGMTLAFRFLLNQENLTKDLPDELRVIDLGDQGVARRSHGIRERCTMKSWPYESTDFKKYRALRDRRDQTQEVQKALKRDQKSWKSKPRRRHVFPFSTSLYPLS